MPILQLTPRNEERGHFCIDLSLSRDYSNSPWIPPFDHWPKQYWEALWLSENPVLLSGKSVHDLKVLLLYYRWKTFPSKQSWNLLVLVPIHAIFCFLLFLLPPLKGNLGACLFHAFMQVSRIMYGPFAWELDLMILKSPFQLTVFCDLWITLTGDGSPRWLILVA